MTYTVRLFPANKMHFIQLKKFCKQILKICRELNISPVAWGGLAYFAYTKDKKCKIYDIDLLVPKDRLKVIMKALETEKIKHRYVPRWHSLIVSKGKLRIELDPIQRYCKRKRQYPTFDFNGLKIKVVDLKTLIKIYKKASRMSKDKPGQHRKRFEQLKEILNLKQAKG